MRQFRHIFRAVCRDADGAAADFRAWQRWHDQFEPRCLLHTNRRHRKEKRMRVHHHARPAAGHRLVQRIGQLRKQRLHDVELKLAVLAQQVLQRIRPRQRADDAMPVRLHACVQQAAERLRLMPRQAGHDRALVIQLGHVQRLVILPHRAKAVQPRRAVAAGKATHAHRGRRHHLLVAHAGIQLRSDLLQAAPCRDGAGLLGREKGVHAVDRGKTAVYRSTSRAATPSTLPVRNLLRFFCRKRSGAEFPPPV